MRVAVTGGGGFIGRFVMDELIRRGHTAISIDRSNGMDLFSPAAESVLLNSHHVIHLAGVLGTAELFDNVPQAVAVNVQGTVRVLETCRQVGAGFTGITMPQVGWKNIYQATKLASMELSEAYHFNCDVPVSHVRAFNAFGVGQHVGSPQKIIPTFADRAFRGEPLPVWGNGTQNVDLVWAGDVATMLVDAMSFKDCEVFDAGTGDPLSVAAVAEYVIQKTGSSSSVSFLPMRAGERETVEPLYARGDGWDTLGYQPTLEWDRLDETIESYRPLEGDVHAGGDEGKALHH